MIAQQSSAVAIVPKGHSKNSPAFQRRVRMAFVSSPAGTAELLEFQASLESGECCLEVTALFPFAFLIFNSCVPNLLKPIEGYPRLLKGIFKKLFFTWALKSESMNLKISVLFNPIQGHSSLFKPPGGRVSMSIKPSSITNPLVGRAYPR